jgi:uncharacterized protein YpiB (UPF0302 family)
MTVEISDRIAAAVLKGVQNMTQVFWVKSRGQRARTNHVAEKNSEVTPFGFYTACLGRRLIQT